MARVKDLWFNERPGPDGKRVKTARHPDLGGNPKAKRWLAVWIVEGRDRGQAFTTEKAAAAHASKMQADIERGEYLDPAAGNATVAPLARKWLRLLEVSAGSAKRYESVWRNHIEPGFGARAVGAVTASQCAAWSKALAGKPETRRLAIIILTGIFDLAVADRLRRDNPVRSRVVGKPRTVPLARDPWAAERIRAVAAACAEHEDLVLTAAALGLREGEVFGLALEDFDTDAGVVQIRRQLSRHAGGFVFKLPKGGRERTVPLPLGVAALIGGESPGVFTLPWLREDGQLASRPRSAALLFTIGGQPVLARQWDRQHWHPALRTAGAEVTRANGMHALRHWYSTLLQDSGVSLAGVTDFLGHSRKSVPLAAGVYGHVTDATFEAARQAVDSALFRPRSVTSDGTVTKLRAV